MHAVQDLLVRASQGWSGQEMAILSYQHAIASKVSLCRLLK